MSSRFNPFGPTGIRRWKHRQPIDVCSIASQDVVRHANKKGKRLLPVGIIRFGDSTLTSPDVIDVPGPGLNNHGFGPNLGEKRGPDFPPEVNGPLAQAEPDLGPVGRNHQTSVFKCCSETWFDLKGDTVADHHHT